MKPLPCYRRATAGPNSFEFGKAVARRLEHALASNLVDLRSIPEPDDFFSLSPYFSIQGRVAQFRISKFIKVMQSIWCYERGFHVLVLRVVGTKR